MKSVNQRREKIQRAANERSKRGGAIKATTNPHNGRRVDLDKEPKPKTQKPQEMAATGKGFAGVRENRNGSIDYGEVDQDGDNRIIVRRDRGGVVLEIGYEDELVEVEIDPTSASNLIENLRAALAG